MKEGIKKRKMRTGKIRILNQTTTSDQPLCGEGANNDVIQINL